jgi:hypothetical protein
MPGVRYVLSSDTLYRRIDARSIAGSAASL